MNKRQIIPRRDHGACIYAAQQTANRGVEVKIADSFPLEFIDM